MAFSAQSSVRSFRDHSPPPVAAGPLLTAGWASWSGEPPPAWRRSPGATSTGGVAPAEAGRSGCASAGGARGPPRSAGPKLSGWAGAGRAASRTGDLGVGAVVVAERGLLRTHSSPAATLSIANNAAITITIIFIIISWLRPNGWSPFSRSTRAVPDAAINVRKT
jgi:hypothetical protein